MKKAWLDTFADVLTTSEIAVPLKHHKEEVRVVYEQFPDLTITFGDNSLHLLSRLSFYIACAGSISFSSPFLSLSYQVFLTRYEHGSMVSPLMKSQFS